MTPRTLFAFIGGCIFTAVVIVKVIGLKLLSIIVLLGTAMWLMGRVLMAFSKRTT